MSSNNAFKFQEQDIIGDWHQRHSKPDQSSRNNINNNNININNNMDQVVLRRRKADARSGKRHSGIETDLGEEISGKGEDLVALEGHWV